LTATVPTPLDKKRGASVLIADDHPPLRSVVRKLLERGGFYVCAEVADAASAIDAAMNLAPDLCLIDIKMPGNGIAATAAIAAMVPQTKIVMLTVSRNELDLFRAIQAGAVGYLIKDEDVPQIAARLWPVLQGEALLSGALTARLLDEFRRAARRSVFARRRRSELLTPREWEVLELLAEDWTTAEIAQLLSIQEVTVRSHIAAALRKYHVTTRQAALRKHRATES
jgi:two-component system nitrate/nitrite response regulator NarL